MTNVSTPFPDLASSMESAPWVAESPGQELAGKVASKARVTRLRKCLQILVLIMKLSMPVGSCLALVSFVLDGLLNAAIIWGFVGCMFLVVLVLERSRCSFHLSLDRSFVLSAEELAVAHRWSTGRWPAADVLAVHVYKQTLVHGRWPWTALELRTAGGTEPVQSPQEARLDPESRMSGRTLTCAFLGAQLRGKPQPMPLTPRTWHEGDSLAELFSLAESVRLLREGRLPLDAFGAVPGERPKVDPDWLKDIATSQTRPMQEAGKEEDPCAVCLSKYELGDLTCKLPCGHIFHSECLIPYLKAKGTCPLCRRVIKPRQATPDTLASPESDSSV